MLSSHDKLISEKVTRFEAGCILRNKYILPQPEQCSVELYTLMKNCWKSESTFRPGFTDITGILCNELQNLSCLKSRSLVFMGEMFNGVFGPVMLAKYESISTSTHVQVEMLNSDKNLTKQLEMLLQLQHPNIVHLIGYCRTTKNMAALVMEYSTYGRLDHILRDNQMIPTKNLVMWISQVADGMAYLEELRVVHLSLNVGSLQLKSPQHAIIGSFELSVQLPSHQDCVDFNTHKLAKAYWKKHSQSAAPECILYNKANSKSDVWSFGIMIWDVFSSTNRTCANETNDVNFYKAIKNGNELIKPPDCPQLLFDLMSSCLQLNATDRPTFENIRNSCHALTESIGAIRSDIPIHITPEQWNDKFHLLDHSNMKCQNEQLYSGFFGSISKGVYTSPLDASEQIVALKIGNIPEEASKRFVNAIHMMSLLRHKNVIDFIGICTNDKVALVLEFAEFGSLRDFLIGNPTTPMDRILSIMHQVTEGMVFMRKRSIVHRNLRAASVLMTSQVQAKISNFEYSEQLEKDHDHCDFQARRSCLRWAAPECLKVEKFHYKSDVFQLWYNFMGSYIVRCMAV